MVMVGERLKDYWESKGALPADIHQYLVKEGFRLTDQWGYPYLIEATTNQFQITSLGSDHRRGGVGDATDIVVRWQQGAEKLNVSSAGISP
jgi:hypothetical protein